MTSQSATASTSTTVHEFSAPVWDGTELFYRAWLPQQPTDRALVLVHRGHEHSGRFADVVETMGLENVAVFAWDARGHGRSPGDRGYAPSFAHMVRDLDSFIEHICKTHDKRIENVVVLAHSVGAVTAATWVHDYAPRIAGLVLATPALRVKLYVPFAIPGLRLLQRLKRGRRSYIKSYVKAKMLTHDVEQAKRYDEDPLIARAIAVNILIDLFDTSTRLIEDAGAIRTPTLLLSGGSDWVVSLDAQKRFFDRLGSPTKKMRVFDGMYHDILHERDRSLVLDEARQFILDAFKRSQRPTPLLEADQGGYTREEYDRLLQPLPAISPKRAGYGFQKLALKTLGRCSDGIRLGWRTGFDSGRSLNYVYDNEARGRLGIGKLIDRAYLDTAGWRGIRQRREHIKELLRHAIQQVASEHPERPVYILDIAAGPGRYVLETIHDLPQTEIHARLRDYQTGNLEEGRALAARWNIANVSFEQADAFDEAGLAAIAPRPDIVIVSGLYELFPENPPVQASLRGLSKTIRPGGYLLYTGQPWHPQLELISRTLPNREGRPWIMRRRTQEEMDDLVRAAGFMKVAMRIDGQGIFTVSLAIAGSRHESD